MRKLLHILRAACVLTVCMFVLTGVIYPAVITGFAQLAFSEKANGSLIIKDGKVIGSELVGQHFTKPEYFWGRPSATVPPYNAAASAASNWSPNNSKLREAVTERSRLLKKTNPADDLMIPVDMVTASGSGLDPHISTAGAEYQVQRVATSRNMTEQRVRELVNMHTENDFLGYGMPRVNVLLLNLSLDNEPKTSK